MTHGLVFDIRKFSLHDGPGIRTTVFLKGCGLRCLWCHNPESQSPRPELILYPERCIGCEACLAACPQGAIRRAEDGRLVTLTERCTRCGSCLAVCYAEARAIAGQEMTVEQVMAEVQRDAAFYEESGGGVTFSGGEPLAQADFLLGLLLACRARGLHTTLDTCGYASEATLHRVRPYVDLFLFDLKMMDDNRHRAATGVSNGPIQRNLRLLAEDGQRVIVRTPIIPGCTDDEPNIRQIGTFVSTLGLTQVDILPYHRLANDKYARLNRPNPLPDLAPLTDARLAEIKHTLENYGLQVRVGG